MAKSRLVRVSADLDNKIRKLQKDIEKHAGVRVTYSEASTAYSKMQNYKNFKVKIKGKGVVEISQ